MAEIIDQAHDAATRRERLIDSLYDSFTVYPMWQSFLATARDIFECDHAVLAVDAWHAGSGAPAIFFERDEDAGTIATLHRAGCFAGSILDQPVEQDRPAAGIRAMLSISILPSDGKKVHLILWRSASAQPFDEAARRLLGEFVPALKRGIRLFYQFVHLTRQHIIAESALETSDIGAMLVDADGHVMHTNSIADEILAQDNGLRLTHGKLKAATPADTTALMDLIREKAAEQQAETDWRLYAPLALPRADNALPLTVIVRPGPAFHPLKNPLQRTAILILRDPERRPIVPARSLIGFFGLSPAEALLASEIARGASIEEAAQRIGISRNTARSQLQSTFMKTGTNRQGELVRMLLSTAAAPSR